MQNADDLIVEVGSRHGYDGELCRSLRLSRDGRMGAKTDSRALEAAENRIAHPYESDFVSALAAARPGTSAGGLLCFWQGLRLMAQGRYHEAADNFEKAGNGPNPLPESQVSPFVAILRKQASLPGSAPAAPAFAAPAPQR